MSAGFYMAAGLMLLLALAFVTVPLLRNRVSGSGVSNRQADIAIYEQRQSELERELEVGSVTQEEYQQTRTELDRQLLADATDSEAGLQARQPGRAGLSALLAGLTVPILAIGLYMVVGFGPAPENPQQIGPGDVEAMVQQLETRLESEPDNGEGWLMLGRSYTVMGRPEEAVEALNRARRLLGDTPDLLITYAQALAAGSEDQSLVGMPAALLDQAVEKAPNHPQALWLSGLAAAQARNPEKVLERWSRLQAVLPPDSEDARMLAQNLSTLKQSLNGDAPGSAAVTPSPPVPPAATDNTGSQRSIEVKVSIAPELADLAGASQTVFVFARAVNGPPMPLAVSRHTVSELPLTITLDDADAMMPGNTISQHRQVQVVARVSKAGDAIASSGDLEADAKQVDPRESPSVELVIDSVRP